MTRPARHAWLAGATGLVGGHLLDQLLDDRAFGGVTSFVRRPHLPGTGGLTELVVDFDRLAEAAPAERPDLVFCCLGTTMARAGSREAFRRVDHVYPLALAALARERGCRSFHVVTAMGADPASAVFYNRVKGETERDLAAMGFDELVLYRPSLLLGDRRERRPGEALAQRLMPLFAPLMLGPLRPYRPIRAEAVATAMRRRTRHVRPGVERLSSDRLQAWADAGEHDAPPA
jgi:uncharacterized protein YbjT (DUF2867 family)